MNADTIQAKLKRLLELQEAVEADGGRDNALKDRYYALLNAVLGREVVGVQSGETYRIVGVGRCENGAACEGVVLVLKADGGTGIVHFGNLETPG